MKKSFNFLAIVLIASFLVSCKKDPATPPKSTVSGRVLQLNTKTPVPNARVYLYESIWSGGLGGGEFTISKDTAITNSKGEYSFEYIQGSKSEFFVNAYANNYYTDSNTRWTIESKKQVRDVIITPYAWISIRVINVPPTDNMDLIVVGGAWGGHDQDFSKSGKCDTIFTKRVPGNQKTKISKWIGYKDPVIIDSVYCKGLDTILHTITY